MYWIGKFTIRVWITFWSDLGGHLEGPTARRPAQQEHGSGAGPNTRSPAYPLCRCLRVGRLLRTGPARMSTATSTAASPSNDAVTDAASAHPNAAGAAATAAATTTGRTGRFHLTRMMVMMVMGMVVVMVRVMIMTITIYNDAARFERLLADRLGRRVPIDERVDEHVLVVPVEAEVVDAIEALLSALPSAPVVTAGAVGSSIDSSLTVFCVNVIT
uniref:Uncharacterized protein n=1 Tax=Anopheles coluzzii TaxID=1518534 RepID=A0A8W7P8Y9_ANOCL